MGALRQGKVRREVEDDEEDEDNGSEGRNDWESVAGKAQIPASDDQGKPLGAGLGHRQQLSAARISLGNRLRGSATGTWGGAGLANTANLGMRKKPGGSTLRK